MIANDKFDPFEVVDYKNWIQRLREMYPNYKEEATRQTKLNLPNPVLYETKELGNRKEHIVHETRNLYLINTEEKFHKL